MRTEVDNWKVGDPKHGFDGCKRPMTLGTLGERLLEPELARLKEALCGQPLRLGRLSLYYASRDSGLPACPECGGETGVSSVTLHNLKQVYWWQCVASPTHPHHGWGAFSRHALRAPYGRKRRIETKPEPAKQANQEARPELPVKPELPEPGPTVKPTTPEPDATVGEPEPDATVGECVHPEIKRVIKYILAGERNIYLTGPAGTGKSHGVSKHVLGALKSDPRWGENCKFVVFAQNQTMGAHEIVGYLDRLAEGAYRPTEIVKAIGVPSLILVEEADKGNPNLAGAWNPLLANNALPTPGGIFWRHQECVIVFVGNTTGHSASRAYRGSVPQDLATIDRFRVFTVNYCRELEKAAVPHATERLLDLVSKLRENLAKAGSQRIVGTRWLRRAADVMRVENRNEKDAITTLLLDESWTDEEIAAASPGVLS